MHNKMASRLLLPFIIKCVFLIFLGKLSDTAIPPRYFYLPHLPHEVQLRSISDFPEIPFTADSSAPRPMALLPDGSPLSSMSAGNVNSISESLSDSFGSSLTGGRNRFWPRQARRLTPLILLCSLSSICTKSAAPPLHLASTYLSFYLPSSPRRWPIPDSIRRRQHPLQTATIPLLLALQPSLRSLSSRIRPK